LLYKRQRCRGNEGGEQPTQKHRRQSENIIKNAIYSLFKITSLINTRDWVLYSWTSLYTCPVCTATKSRVFRQSSFSIGRAPVNPYVPGGFSFLRVQEYLVSGTTMCQHRHTTIQVIFQGLVIRRRSLIILYLGDSSWRSFDLKVLASQGQEVEFQKETRRERANR